MDWGLFFQAAGVGVAVLGFVAGGFYWLWGQITKIRDDAEEGIKQAKQDAALRTEAAHAVASSTREELHQHKLVVAENYVSKQGLREQTEQIMAALGGLGEQIRGMNGRIDRMLERPATGTRARSVQ